MNYGVYSFLRNAYHRNLNWAQKYYEEEKLQDLINCTYAESLNKLYNKMKAVAGSSIDINKFRLYCQDLFKSKSFSSFTLIPKVDLEEHPVIRKLVPNEVTNVLKNSKSKAKSNMGICTFDIKKLTNELTPFLCQIFNDILSGCSSVPKKWLEVTMLFIYKDDSDKLDPEKHRTICVQNPLLKAFMSTITSRIDDHAEKNNLYPTYQF